jgi:hypothetical protein
MLERVERLSCSDLEPECLHRVDNLNDQALIAFAPEQGDLQTVVGPEVELLLGAIGVCGLAHLHLLSRVVVI